MPDKLKWGIISTAGINRQLIPAIREATRSELLAVASRSREKGQAYAAKWSIAKAFDSYEALLADPNINTVYISLPNSLHCEWAVKAAQAGKNILCEKPLALSVADVDKMAQAAADDHVVLLEAFMYRMHPQIARLQQLIADGMIGEVKLVKASFTFPLKDERNVRLIKELGGGSLWDMGGYPVSFCQAAAGADPVEVFAWQRLHANGVENGMVAQMRYANGVMAQIECGFYLPQRRGAEVAGDKGVASLIEPFVPDAPGRPNGHIHVVAGDMEADIRTKPSNPYLCEVQVMENAVLDGIPGPYTLAHTRANIATIVALYQSAESGQPVQITR